MLLISVWLVPVLYRGQTIRKSILSLFISSYVLPCFLWLNFFTNSTKEKIASPIETDFDVRGGDSSKHFVMAIDFSQLPPPTSNFPAKKKQTNQIQASSQNEAGKNLSYKTKEIKFRKRDRQIVLQSENGPCPLIAICMRLFFSPFSFRFR